MDESPDGTDRKPRVDGGAIEGTKLVESHEPAARRVVDWNGAALEKLAEEYGTPLYVTDLDRVRENYRRIADAFHEAGDVDVMYAAKANTGRAVISALVDEGARIECAAMGEVERAVRAGEDPGKIQYTGVNPPDGDLDYVVDLWRDHPGLTVNVGARDSVIRLEERGFDGRLCLRVNPGVAAGHHEKVETGNHPKFGIPYDGVEDLAEHVRRDHSMDLGGLHAHMGSGLLEEDLDTYLEYVDRMAELAAEVGDLEFVDAGGGFGVPYRPEVEPLDVEKVAERTVETYERDGLDATLAVEPGRYVVADASVLLTRVNTVKRVPDTTVVGVDASMTTMIRPAMYGAYHPIRNVTNPDADEVEATVGGPVCESSDTFCYDRPLSRPRRNDLLAIGTVGAYGYEMASMFHSQPRPADVGVEDGEVRVIREREDIDDVVRQERG